MAKAKVFVVAVLTGPDDTHPQLARIMGAKGCGHIVHRGTTYRSGFNYPMAYIAMTGYTNKAVCRQAVKVALGDAYLSNINEVIEYSVAYEWGLFKGKPRIPR